MLDRYHIFMKNQVKSIDQFGQTDTIIMDDYFFIDKNLFQLSYKKFNEENECKVDELMIFSLIEKSEFLKDQMYDSWISIMRHYRSTYPRGSQSSYSSYSIEIKNQRVLKQSARQSVIVLTVEVKLKKSSLQTSFLEQQSKPSPRNCSDNKKYIFRFTQKPRLSAIDRIKNQQLKDQIRKQTKQKNHLFLMIEVMESIGSFQSLEGIQTFSRNYERSKFQFAMLLKCKISQGNTLALSLLKNEQVIKKQNLIIMSTKKWKYIQVLLESNQINTAKTITLQQKQFQGILYDINSHLNQLKQTQNRRTECQIILAIDCNLVSYLSRPEISRGIHRLTRYTKYIIFHNCSQYEKEICCINLFQIFPLHIYLSNYLCDLNVIQKSNLSICQNGMSSEPYVTLVVTSYKNLRYLIIKQAVESINISVFIVKSHVFKNQTLVIAIAMVQFLIYQGRYFVIGIQYTSFLFLIYNLMTSLPLIYYIIYRPQVWQQPFWNTKKSLGKTKFNYFQKKMFLKEFSRALLTAALISLFNFSFLLSSAIQNNFFSVLTSCVIATGFYYLFIDDARRKRIQIVLILLQSVLFYVLIYLLEIFNNNGFQLVLIQVNITQQNIAYFFVSNIVALPFVLGLMFYGMSAINAKIQPEEQESQAVSYEGSSFYELPAKTTNDYGKQLRFRQD